MLLLAWLACTPAADPSKNTTVDTTDTAVVDTDTDTVDTSDTGTANTDTDTTTPGRPSTDCVIVGDWDLQIRGWIDRGWTVSFRQGNTGCVGDVQLTGPAGTIDIWDIVLDIDEDGTWTATGTDDIWNHESPLVFRRDGDLWQVDGMLTWLASVWTLTPR